MSGNNVTFGELLTRVEALEAAAKPADRDQQAERIDALERELGAAKEVYRQSVENHKACLEQLRVAVERADANQSAADTLERLKIEAQLPEGERLVLWSKATTSEHKRVEAERDALAAKVAELDRFGGVDTVQSALVERGDKIIELTSKVADLERRLADSEKQPDPPKCPKCGGNRAFLLATTIYTEWYCPSCPHRWPKEATK